MSSSPVSTPELIANDFEPVSEQEVEQIVTIEDASPTTPTPQTEEKKGILARLGFGKKKGVKFSPTTPNDEEASQQQLLQQEKMKKRTGMLTQFQKSSAASTFEIDEWGALSVDQDHFQFDSSLNSNKNSQHKVAVKKQAKQQQQEVKRVDEYGYEVSDSDEDSELLGDGDDEDNSAFMTSKENQYEIQFEQERQRMKEKFESMTTVMDIHSFLQDEFGNNFRQKIVDLQVQTLEDMSNRYCLISVEDKVYILQPNARLESERVRTYKCNLSKNFQLTRCFMSPTGQHILVTSNNSSNEKQSENFYLNATETETVGKKSDILVTHKIEQLNEEISAVGWQPDLYDQTEENEELEYDTGTIIVGTAAMKLIKLKLVKEERAQRYDMEVVKLYELRKLYVTENVMFPLTPNIPIDGVQCVTFKYGKKYRSMVLVSTRIGLTIFYADDVSAEEIGDIFEDYQVIASIGSGSSNATVATQSKRKPISRFVGEDDEFTFSSELRLVRKSNLEDSYDVTVEVEEESDPDTATEGIPISFAWATHSGILHGTFLPDPEETLEHATILPYDVSETGRPISIALSEFHIFVAFEYAFQIYMQPAELGYSSSKYSLLSKVVYSSSRHLTLNLECKEFLRFAVDDSSYGQRIYLVTDSECILFLTEDETIGMWKLYLEQALDTSVTSARLQYFMKALRLCSDFEDHDGDDASAHKRVVYEKMGQYFFESGRLKKASECFARTDLNFDEIVIKLMEKDPDDIHHGLYTYLYFTLKRHKLTHATSSANTKEITKQAVCLCVWIIELLVHKINLYSNLINQTITVKCSNIQFDQQHEEKSQAAQNKERTRAVLRKFMFQNKEILETCRAIIYNVLISNGFMNDFLFFAVLIADYEVAIQHCLTIGKIGVDQGKEDSQQYFAKALWILDEFCHEKERGHDELWYKYAPMLMQTHAAELLKSFEDYKILDPASLIPALLRYSQLTQLRSNQRRMRQGLLAQSDPLIKYLSHCIDDMKNDQPVIHNLMVYFLAQKMSPEILDSFLRKDSDQIHYTKEYALRTCLQYSKYTSCVILYGLMGLYDEAVDMALMRNDAKEALRIALNNVEDLELKKKLILKIVKFLIRTDKQRANTSVGRQQSIELITGDFGDVLKLDDILKLFPPNTNLEQFSEHIRTILTRYRYNSNQLKLQIREGTNDAELIRNDLTSMKTTKDISDDYKCDHCGRPAALEKFFVFPCTHAFHLRCLKEMYTQRLRTAKSVIVSTARKNAELKRRRELEKKKRLRMRAERYKAEMNGELHMLAMKLEAIEAEPIEINTSDLELVLSQEQQDEIAGIDAKLEQVKHHEEVMRGLKEQQALVTANTMTGLEIEVALQKELRVLSNIIADECPLDGSMMIEEISTPLITLEDEKKMDAWKIVHRHPSDILLN